MNTRLTLRKLGESDESIFVFSFYPDVITLKEVGDPLQLGEFFGLDKRTKGKDYFCTGKTKHKLPDISYACHPFFIQGVLLDDKR